MDQKVNMMLEKEAAIRFDSGQFKRAIVTPAPLVQGEWVLQLERKDKSTAVISRQRGGVRHFKTIDAAYRTAIKIGFRTISVSS
jgi:hypothetical protein